MSPTRRRRGSRAHLGVLGLVLAAGLGPALAGCSPGTPYAPGPSVVPYGPAATARPAVRPADLDLSGDVQTTDGLAFHVAHQVWFGDVTSTLPDRGSAPVGWTRVQRAATGLTVVTNTSARANPAAAATSYTFYAGYAAGSTVCRLAARQEGAEVVRDRCWLRLGTTVPYSYGIDEPASRLGVGESRQGVFDAMPPDTVDAPVGQFGEVAEALRQPRDIVVLAAAISGMAHPAYRNGCRTGDQGFVIVGGSSPLGCRDVPGNG